MKIKAELLKQLDERKLQVVGLERSVRNLEIEVKEKDELINNLKSLPRSNKTTRRFLSNWKVHFQKRNLRSVSMPEKLDCVGRSKKGLRNNFVEAIKKRSNRIRVNHKLKEPDHPEPSGSEVTGTDSGDYQSFTSRW